MRNIHKPQLSVGVWWFSRGPTIIWRAELCTVCCIFILFMRPFPFDLTQPRLLAGPLVVTLCIYHSYAHRNTFHPFLGEGKETTTRKKSFFFLFSYLFRLETKRHRGESFFWCHSGETRLSRDERGAGRFFVKLVNSTTNSNKGLALLDPDGDRTQLNWLCMYVYIL